MNFLSELLWFDSGLEFEVPDPSHCYLRETTHPSSKERAAFPEWMNTPGRTLVEEKRKVCLKNSSVLNLDGDALTVLARCTVLARWAILVSKYQAAMAPSVSFAAAVTFITRALLTVAAPDRENARFSLNKEWRKMCISANNKERIVSCWGINDTAFITEPTLRALKYSWHVPASDVELSTSREQVIGSGHVACVSEDIDLSKNATPTSSSALGVQISLPPSKMKANETEATIVESADSTAEDKNPSPLFELSALHCDTPQLLVRIRTRKGMFRINLVPPYHRGSGVPTMEDLQIAAATRFGLPLGSRQVFSLDPGGKHLLIPPYGDVRASHKNCGVGEGGGGRGGEGLSLLSTGIGHGGILFLIEGLLRL